MARDGNLERGYSYSSRWDQGMESRVGCGGSSTSTALRAEYEYGYGGDGPSFLESGDWELPSVCLLTSAATSAS